MLLSLSLTLVTAVLLIPSLDYFQKEINLLAVIIESLGSLIGKGLYVFIFGFVFCIYLFLFYRFEKRRFITVEFFHLLEEVERIASGRFDEKVSSRAEAGLGKLVESINNVVIQAKTAIDEERRAEQVKSDLITNVAHDLRSPLTSIIGYLNLINEDNYRDEVELRYYIQIVNTKAERLHDLINDLFEYTYVQNKETLSNETPINIEEMINQLVVQHRIQIQEAGMEMRQFITTTDPVVIGNGNKLARVFENLIQNAIRYGTEGKYVDIYVKDSLQTVEVEVVNYGKTIPKVDLPYIFERFYRVEKSRSEYTGGSGLGLAIAQSIAKLHGGEIKVDSSKGRTSFVVSLIKKYNR